MGTLLAPVGQICCQTHAQYVNVVILIFLFSVFCQRIQILSSEFLSSANHPDNWLIVVKVVNYLTVRILQQKTRQSDSFSEILGFSKNHRYVQLSLILIKLIPPTGWEEPVLMWFPKVLLVSNISYPSICVFLHKTLQVAIKSLLLWKLKPESAVRACLDFVILEEWILFGF